MRVAFDAAANAVQVDVEGGELNVGLDDFADAPRIEEKRVFARLAATALAPQFAANITALEGVNSFLNECEIEL